MSEVIRIRKDEWEDLRKDLETFIKDYNDATEQAKKLAKENITLRQELEAARERLATADRKVAADLQQTSQAIQKLRADISRAIQQTKKEA